MVYENYETRMTDLDDLTHRVRTEWITPSLQLLCISGVVVSQCASRPAAVVSRTVFDLNVVFAAITATFLAVVDHSNSCTVIGRIV